MPGGRPTDYKPEYCELVIEHMSKGYSFESFAGIVEVSKQCIYEWRAKHSEFGDAVAIGFSKCQIFWEQKGMEGLWNSKDNYFSQNVWSFNMKNRFKWTDRTEVEAGEKLNKVIKLAYNLDDEDK